MMNHGFGYQQQSMLWSGDGRESATKRELKEMNLYFLRLTSLDLT